MKYMVQILKAEPKCVRKHWHQVEASDTKDAIVRLLRKAEKSVPRLARALKGDAWVAVAWPMIGNQKNIRDNGMPIMVDGFNVRLMKVA